MRGSAAFRASVTPGGALAGPWTRNLLWSRARAVPSLDLRFAENKSLTDATTGQNLVTFTRASSGTYVDSTGTLRTATTNEARFDHNPTTGESLGLLAEEQRTNLLPRSEEFDNASWTKVSATVTANNATSPSGDQTADTLIATSTVFARVQQNVSLSTGGYALSIHAKPGSVPFSFGTVEVSGQVLRLYFNASTGAVGQTMETGTISATSSSIKLANGWWRFVWIINVPTTATYTVYFTVSNSYNNPSVAIGDSLNLWGAQLEAGAFPTSYIPTTTATVTRSADVASITGTNFSSWYRQDEGTVFVDSARYALGNSAGQYIVCEAGNSAFNNNDLIQLGTQFGSNSFQMLVNVGNVTQAALVEAGVVTQSKYVGAYRANDFAYTKNGASPATDTSGTTPTVSQLNIGSRPAFGNTGYLNGTIRRLTYWPQRLPNSTLQQITQ